MTTGDGTPLAVIVSAANRHDVNFLLPQLFTSFPRLGGLRAARERSRAESSLTQVIHPLRC